METFISKQMRPAYGFDEVAIVPGDYTVNPDQTDVSFQIEDETFRLPVVAARMDAVTDPSFAAELTAAGGLAILNLEGLHGRLEDPYSAIEAIANEPDATVTHLMQEYYAAPIQDDYVARTIEAIKDKGGKAAVSFTPLNAKRLGPVAAEAGADYIVVQSTVTTARHYSKSPNGLHFEEFVQQIKVPVIVGNTVTYSATLELLETGVAGILVGVGPGSACTSREVLGIGVPQVTSTLDTSAARDAYEKQTGRYVPIITDGGIRTGGDVCKSIVAGADAVMLGSMFAGTQEAPGHGYHWGMATPHAALPRGVRVYAGTQTTLQRLLSGPTERTNGTENLIGSLQTAMGMCGATNLREMHDAQLVIAPSIKTEGKQLQGR